VGGGEVEGVGVEGGGGRSGGGVRDVGYVGGGLGRRGRGSGGVGLEGGYLCGGCRFVMSKTPFNISQLLFRHGRALPPSHLFLDFCLALAVLRSSFSALRIRISTDRAFSWVS